jgi:hypothetical protein
MLVKELVSHIINVLNHGPAADDSRISERQVYFILKYLRAKLIKQKADKYNYISPFNYQTLECLPLVQGTFSECECFDEGCVILRSEWKIPNIIVNRNQLMLKGIFTQSGEEIYPATDQDIKRFKYSKTKNKPGRYTYEIKNNYLFVRGDDRLKVVKFTGILEDPLEANIPGACGDGITDCFNPETMNFPIDLELTEAICKMTYDEIFNVMMRIPIDNENDAKDNLNVENRSKRR